MRECLERLAGLATRSDEIGIRAKVGLGHDLRALISRGQIDLAEHLIETVTKARGRYWPEAFSSLGDVLSYDKEGLEPGVENRVRKLIESLTPDELAERVRFLVTEMPWDYPGDEKLDYDVMNKRQSDAVYQLVTDLLQEPETLAKFLPPSAAVNSGCQRCSVARWLSARPIRLYGAIRSWMPLVPSLKEREILPCWPDSSPGPETPERRYRPSIRQVHVRGERQIPRGVSAITWPAASTPVRYAPT